MSITITYLYIREGRSGPRGTLHPPQVSYGSEETHYALELTHYALELNTYVRHMNRQAYTTIALAITYRAYEQAIMCNSYSGSNPSEVKVEDVVRAAKNTRVDGRNFECHQYLC